MRLMCLQAKGCKTANKPRIQERTQGNQACWHLDLGHHSLRVVSKYIMLFNMPPHSL